MGQKDSKLLGSEQCIFYRIPLVKAVISTIDSEDSKLPQLQTDCNTPFFSNPLIKYHEELDKLNDTKVKLEDFQTIKVLGKGIYGDVILVQHKEEETFYVLKRLRKKDIIRALEVEHAKSERK